MPELTELTKLGFAKLVRPPRGRSIRSTPAPGSPFRVDIIGSASLHATTRRYHDNAEDVRLRCAQRASSLEQAELLWEVESLLCCGYRGSITPSVITYSASMAHEKVTPRTEILVA